MGNLVEIYTDGACSGNPGPGGWGALLIYKGHERELSGGEADTTNNRMELMAAIQALESLKRPCRVRLHTDSTYVRSGITEWIQRWRQNGWRTAAKKPVLNQDLWSELDRLNTRSVRWQYTRGHAGDEDNERCDDIAQAFAQGLEPDMIQST